VPENFISGYNFSNVYSILVLLTIFAIKLHDGAIYVMMGTSVFAALMDAFVFTKYAYVDDEMEYDVLPS
jgi:hypothetical protein